MTPLSSTAMSHPQQHKQLRILSSHQTAPKSQGHALHPFCPASLSTIGSHGNGNGFLVPPGSRLFEQVLDDLRHEPSSLSISSSSSCDSSCSCSCSSLSSSSSSSSPSPSPGTLSTPTPTTTTNTTAATVTAAAAPYNVTFQAELRQQGGGGSGGKRVHASPQIVRDLDQGQETGVDRQGLDLERDRRCDSPRRQGLSSWRAEHLSLSDNLRSNDTACLGSCPRCGGEVGGGDEGDAQAAAARDKTSSLARDGDLGEKGRPGCLIETKDRAADNAGPLSLGKASGSLRIWDFVEDLNLKRFQDRSPADDDSSRCSGRKVSGDRTKNSAMGQVPSLGHHGHHRHHHHQHARHEVATLPSVDSVDALLCRVHDGSPQATRSRRRYSSPATQKDPQVARSSKDVFPAKSLGNSQAEDATDHVDAREVASLSNGLKCRGDGGERLPPIGRGISEGTTLAPGHVISWSLSASNPGRSHYFTSAEDASDPSLNPRSHPPLSRLYPRTAAGSESLGRHHSPSPCRQPEVTAEGGWGPELDPHLRHVRGRPVSASVFSPCRPNADEGRRVSSFNAEQGDPGGRQTLTVPLATSGGTAQGSAGDPKKSRSPSASPVLHPRGPQSPPEPTTRVRQEPLFLRELSTTRSCSSLPPGSHHQHQHQHNLRTLCSKEDATEIGARDRLVSDQGVLLPDWAAKDLALASTTSSCPRPRSQSDVSAHAHARRRRQLPRPPSVTAEEDTGTGGHVHWADERRGSPLATSVLLHSIRPRASSHGAVDLPRKPILKKPFGF